MSYSDDPKLSESTFMDPSTRSLSHTLKPHPNVHSAMSNPTSSRRSLKPSTLFLFLITTILTFFIIHLRLNPSTQFTPAGLSNLIINNPYFDYYYSSDLQAHQKTKNDELEDSHRLRLSKSKSEDDDEDDYNKYVWHKEILPDWDPASNRRLIVFGDIHGMAHSLRYLLATLNYNSGSDTVLLVGDLVAKHPSIQASLDTVRYCRESKFEVIRGNHDQYVIIWRNWMEDNRQKFVESEEIESYRTNDLATLEFDTWLQSPQPPQGWKKKLPEGMKWRTQHFEIARRLPKVDFQWLLNKTLTMYVRPIGTYFVHAGMLPWLPPNEAMRLNQKASLLTLKENQDPYTLLEMRGLRKGRKPTRDGKKGKPWYRYWNKTMRSCNGTTGDDEIRWCQATYQVVYGHWAGKGLTLNPWSIGLDSGCVYGRQLSALVIGGGTIQDHHSLDQAHHQNLKTIPVEMRGYNGTVVSIPCDKPQERRKGSI